MVMMMMMRGAEYALNFTALIQDNTGSLLINANAHMYKIHTNCMWLSMSMCKKAQTRVKILYMDLMARTDVLHTFAVCILMM